MGIIPSPPAAAKVYLENVIEVLVWNYNETHEKQLQAKDVVNFEITEILNPTSSITGGPLGYVVTLCDVNDWRVEWLLTGEQGSNISKILISGYPAVQSRSLMTTIKNRQTLEFVARAKHNGDLLLFLAKFEITTLSDALRMPEIPLPTMTKPGKIEFKIMPIPTGVTTPGGWSNISDIKGGFAIRCSCGNENIEKSLTCKHVVELYEDRADQSFWSRSVLTLLSKYKTGVVEIAIPVLGVLHRIAITRKDLIQWDESVETKYLIQPRSWFDRELGRFYDLDSNPMSGCMRDQIKLLEEGMICNAEAMATYKTCKAFSEGKVTLHCMNMNGRGQHNYGVTKQLQTWINEASPSNDRVLTLAFCTQMYGICYICYRNSEPTFSLATL